MQLAYIIRNTTTKTCQTKQNTKINATQNKRKTQLIQTKQNKTKNTTKKKTTPNKTKQAKTKQTGT